MYKNGLCIKVVKNGIYGIIDGEASGIYSMVFFENGHMYFRADVTEGTIRDNLKYGSWEITEPQPYML